MGMELARYAVNAVVVEELQGQIDWFVNYYNETRPHKALNRKTDKRRGPKTPKQAFDAKPKAKPGTYDGELLRTCTIDPDVTYQRQA